MLWIPKWVCVDNKYNTCQYMHSDYSLNTDVVYMQQ